MYFMSYRILYLGPRDSESLEAQLGLKYIKYKVHKGREERFQVEFT